MGISRREFLRLSGLVAGGAVLASCSPLYRHAGRLLGDEAWGPPPSPATAAWLRRLTYGASAWDRLRLSSLGLDGYLEEQLAYREIEDRPADLRLRTFDHLGLDADVLVGWKKKNLAADFGGATIVRKVYSRRQLFEQLVEFWTDHFNISLAKGDCWFLKVVDDEQVIRQHALGNFCDLLWASAHSPAMLVYLDNQANFKDAPNENYARELLELHTLGVDGGYNQMDVMELARCLTGWGVKRHFWRGDFQFDEDAHDPGPKTVLRVRVEPSGIQEAERLLDILALHPSTARYISMKLVRRFISDRPIEEASILVEQGAEAFLRTGGDISATLRAILQAGTQAEERFMALKFKRPMDFILSALRQLETESDGGPALHGYLGEMGQPLYEWPTPDGPPDHADSWGNLLPRWKFALALAQGEIKGTKIDYPELLAGLPQEPGGAQTLLQAISQRLDLSLPDETLQSLAALLDGETLSGEPELPAMVAAGLVASPAFQWR